MSYGSGTTSYSYDDADRLTTVTPPSPASAVSYTWDNNGDLTARGSDSFSWDYEDRMVSATVGGTTTTFAYRGDGLRDSRTSGGVTTTFAWDVNVGLPVVLDDGAQYVYGLGLVSQVSGANTYYYLADGLGSTMKTVDSSGTVVNSYTYDVYGQVTTSSGGQANEFQFAGQQTDPTGLQYLRARYYDPATGRFISRDPLAVTPRAENPFAFGAASPTMRTDPTGLREVDADGCEPANDNCHRAQRGACAGYWCFFTGLTTDKAGMHWDEFSFTPDGHIRFRRCFYSVVSEKDSKSTTSLYCEPHEDYESTFPFSWTDALLGYLQEDLKVLDGCAADFVCSQLMGWAIESASAMAFAAGVSGLGLELQAVASAWYVYSASRQQHGPPSCPSASCGS